MNRTRTKRIRDRKAGRPPKLEHPVRLEVLLESAQKDAISMLAKSSGMSMNDVVRDAVDAYLGGRN